MIAELVNLDPIKKASVDLQRPFTLFCGPNNTGKTYMSYLIYAIYEESNYIGSKIVNQLTQKFVDEQEISINFECINQFISDIAENMKIQIGSIFGIGDTQYADQNPCTTVYRLVRQFLGQDNDLNEELNKKVQE